MSPAIAPCCICSFHFRGMEGFCTERYYQTMLCTEYPCTPAVTRKHKLPRVPPQRSTLPFVFVFQFLYAQQNMRILNSPPSTNVQKQTILQQAFSPRHCHCLSQFRGLFSLICPHCRVICIPLSYFKGTVSVSRHEMDIFFEGQYILIRTSCVCADSFQDLSKAYTFCFFEITY